MQTLGYMDGFPRRRLDMAERNHARRFGAIWIVSTLIATPLVVVLLVRSCHPATAANRPRAT